MGKLGRFELDTIYNEDCYKSIKDIPDKSIDCIYVDIPYVIQSGGASESPLSQRAKRLRNIELRDIKDGIDYSIFDELEIKGLIERIEKVENYIKNIKEKKDDKN